MDMVDAKDRGFKLALTIKDNPDFDGAHAVMALGLDDNDTPILAIEAGGFPPTAEGAAELADMLRDTADAIDDHLARPRPHHDTASLPTINPERPKRPRFNPKPRGAQQ